MSDNGSGIGIRIEVSERAIEAYAQAWQAAADRQVRGEQNLASYLVAEAKQRHDMNRQLVSGSLEALQEYLNLRGPNNMDVEGVEDDDGVEEDDDGVFTDA